MKDPAALLYIDKWLVSTKGMKADARGWYLNLILHQYDKGFLPNDIEELANYADVRMSEYEKFKQVWEQVLKHKFEQTEEGNLENAYAKEILRKREQFLEKRILSGKIGYVIKFVKANFKVTSKCIEWLKNELDFDSLDINDKQVLKQVLEQKIKLYINKDENEDINTNEVYKKCVEIFFEVYQNKFSAKPGFNGADGKHLKELISKLEPNIKTGTLPDAFRVLLEKLPKFYKDKMDLKIINSNYNGIIAEIRTKSGFNGQDVMQNLLDKRKREREEATANG